MTNFYSYLLEINIVLAVLVSGFVLLLKNIPQFQLNRVLLLSILVISFSVPFLSIPTFFPETRETLTFMPSFPKDVFELPVQENAPAVDSKEVAAQSEFSENETLVTTHKKTSHFSLLTLLVYGYWLGVIVFFVAFLLQSIRLVSLTRAAKSMQWEGRKLDISPIPEANFSFFHRIYVSEQWFTMEENEKRMVLLHEREHIRQGHSYDILFLELIKILCWFNPAVWILKKLLRLVHEYQADYAVKANYPLSAYAELLLDFSRIRPIKLEGTHTISTFFNLKKRLTMLTQTPKKQPIWRYATFLMLVGISCTLNEDYAAVTYSDNLKYIESVYISHQADTQDKNNRRVAIAYYNPDGTFQKAMQHMTYPYTEMVDREIELWTTPKLENIPFIMDGFTLGEAKKNLMYGNDWPKTYAKHIQKLYTHYNKRDVVNGNADIEYNGDLPTKIKAVKSFSYESSSSRKLLPDPEEITQFEYVDNKISTFSLGIDYKFEIILDPSKKGKNKIVSSKKSHFHTLVNANYYYDGENLVEVNEGRKKYKFYYEEDKLIKSEFYIANQLMHHREYSYKEDGRRDKTLIYNTMNEPEYTIEYNYGYYEAE